MGVCRTVLLCFAVQAILPNGLELPWKLYVELGPRPAFGQPAAACDASDPLLAPTPDADCNDPFIFSRAAALGHDAGAIFAYVRDEIGYEAYSGSLRGARGALSAEAGNGFDQASLLVALLRASGVPARYARGTLNQQRSRELVRSMFPEALVVSGFLPDGALSSDPANDAGLLAEASDHVWVELDQGGGFVPADPSFAGALIGDTFANANETFAEVPAELRHTVRIELRRESALPFAGFLGADPLGEETVLDETFSAAELFGRPVSVSHFVNQSQLAGPAFGAFNNSYTPYLLVSDVAGGTGEAEPILGTPYGEVLTNFPFGSTVLTALFLEVELGRPDGTRETFERALVDRIGFDIRTHGGTPNLTFDADSPPLVNDLDVFTLNVVGGRFTLPLDGIAADLGDASEAIAALEDDAEISGAEAADFRRGAVDLTSVLSGAFLLLSDVANDLLSSSALVRAYQDAPRLFITSSRLEIDTDQNNEVTLLRSIDLLHDRIRAVPHPGQAVDAARAFQATRGVLETNIERNLFSALIFQEDRAAGSAATVLEEAVVQAVPLVVLGPADRARLDGLDVSVEAKARIDAALAAGRSVIVPSSSVVIEEVPRIAWLEIDPASGATIGVTEDGRHQGMTEYIALFAFVAIVIAVIVAILKGPFGCALCRAFGTVTENLNQVSAAADNVGTAAGGVQGPAPTPDPRNICCDCLAKKQCPKEECDKLNITCPQTSSSQMSSIEAQAIDAAQAAATTEAHPAAADAIERVLSLPLFVTGAPLFSEADPPIGSFLFSPEATGAFSGLAGPGVAIDVVPDPTLFVPAGGAQVPTAFLLGIKNTSSDTHAFRISFSNLPAGFEGRASLDEVVVAPGEVAEIGVYLIPSGALPAPGSLESFTVGVTSTTNPGVSASASESFTVPEIHGVSITASPAAVSTTPGTTSTVELLVESVGNVSEDVTFATDLSDGLTLSGLAPLALAAGEATTLMLLLTPDAGVSLNSTLAAFVSADFGAPEPAELSIPVRVVVPGADAVGRAAVALAALGEDDLAARLGDLETALTHLVQNPSSEVFRSQALAALDAILSLLSADRSFSGFAETLRAARDALAAATDPPSLLLAVNGIGASLDSFDDLVAAFVRHDLEISLLPNTQTAQPGAPTSFEVRVRNLGTERTTYDLALLDLPASVTGELSQLSVTLDPGELATGLFATLTQAAGDEVLPFAFEVQASVAGMPGVFRRASGAFTARDELVSVVSVTADPPFVDPGAQVAVSTRVLNAVNRTRAVAISYVVKDSGGAVVFTSTPVAATLGVLATLDTFALGTFDTTGFELGAHTIEVTLSEQGGEPIAGGSGFGSLLVGSPVTASLSVLPGTLPQGDGTVMATLDIASDVEFDDPFALVGQVAVGGAADVAVRDDRAYVCSSGGIAVVNIANPEAPTVIKTVGSPAQRCVVHGNLLFTASSPPAIFLRVYSLTDPNTPALIGSTSVPYNFIADLLVTDTHAFVAQFLFCFFLSNNDLFTQHGDVLSFDVSNPATPVFRDVLFNTHGTTMDGNETSGCGENGGSNNIFTVTLADPTTLLAASSTATGTNTRVGVGRIVSVDVSDPANLAVASTLDIPGTRMVIGVGLDGDRGLATSSSDGWNDFGDLGLDGNVVITTLDASDPRNLEILTTKTLARDSRGVGGAVSLGNDLYAFGSLGGDGDPAQLFLVDASDPLNPVASAIDVPAEPVRLESANDLLFTASAVGLSIYELGEAASLPVTAEVRIPNDTGVEVVPGSFSLAPDEIVSEAGFDTLIWRLGLASGSEARTITWGMNVLDLQPGEAREVSLDSSVSFAVLGAEGMIPLPPLVVAGEQILGIIPSTQTVAPGESATYSLSLRNPTGAPVTYELSVDGVPRGWVDLAPSVQLPAVQNVFIDLTLHSDPFAPPGELGFVVTATSNGATGSVGASLVLEGEPVVPEPEPASRGVIVELAPDRMAAGRGNPAVFRARVTNTGSQTQTFALSAVVPAGFAASFDRGVVDVPPGASQFREVQLVITPPLGAAPGDQPFSVTATQSTDESVQGADAGTIEVLGFGVDVAITPPSGVPGSAFQVTVTNTGSLTDTFHVSMIGAAGNDASPQTFDVGPLAPGASGQTSVALGPLEQALPGSLDLVALAVSAGDERVRDAATAIVEVADRRVLSARCEPGEQEVAAPGDATFLIKVENEGNRGESYNASIVATSGPVDATLQGLDGAPVQVIPVFILPGLASGALGVNATLTDPGDATVTVEVTTLEVEPPLEPATAMATCRLTSDGDNAAPVVDAGPSRALPPDATISVAATFTDANPGDTHTATVDWGDGSDPTAGVVNESAGSGTVTAQHVYAGTGPFTVTVCVEDQAGAQACDDFVVGLVDHFLFYQVRLAPRSAKLFPIGPVVLSDGFGSDEYRLLTPRWTRWLGLPADKNQEGIFDEATHLEEYRVQPFQGRFDFARTRNVRIVNQCSDLLLDVRRPYSLLMPTAKDMTAPVEPPIDEEHHLDHYLCYKAEPQKKADDGTRLPGLPVGMQVVVKDQLQERRYDLTRITKLCSPAATSGEPRTLSGPEQGAPFPLAPASVENPGSHLVCYRATLAKKRIEQAGCGASDPKDKGVTIVPKQPKHESRSGVFLANQLETTQVDTLGERELCIPSEVSLQER